MSAALPSIFPPFMGSNLESRKKSAEEFAYLHIHSEATLLETPVQLLLNAFIYSANHMVTTQCVYACRHGQDYPLKFKLSIRMGKKVDLTDFERGMVISARRAGLSISETADVGFSRTVITRVDREWSEKEEM